MKTWVSSGCVRSGAGYKDTTSFTGDTVGQGALCCTVHAAAILMY